MQSLRFISLPYKYIFLEYSKPQENKFFIIMIILLFSGNSNTVSIKRLKLLFIE
jgi:hypothetical protein